MENSRKYNIWRHPNMEKHKLIGMVTTNRNINAVFSTGGSEIPSYEMGFPVVGIVLVEDMTGQQYIQVMYKGDSGLVEYLEQGKKGFIELRPCSRGLNINKAI